MNIKSVISKIKSITKVNRKNTYEKYRGTDNPLDVDKQAIASDWINAGNDMKHVIYGKK